MDRQSLISIGDSPRLAIGIVQTSQDDQTSLGIVIQIASYPCVLMDRYAYPTASSATFAALTFILKHKETVSCELRPKVSR